MNKTFSEFKSDFDLLYNNIANAAAPGFTDEEIAQMAQMATEKVCLSVYNGTLKSEGFEVTEEVTSYINGLTRQVVFTEDGENKFEQNPRTVLDIQGDHNFYSRVCKLDETFWFIVYESVKYKDGDDCLDGSNVAVKPITHDSLYRIMQNPFVGRTMNRVLRLLIEKRVELISYKKEIAEYLVRYMDKPDFGFSTSQDWDGKILEDINDSLYRVIVEYTVNIAKNIWAS